MNLEKQYFDWQIEAQVLTDEEIIDEYKNGNNNGMLEFARSVELMTIKKYQAKVAQLESK